MSRITLTFFPVTPQTLLTTENLCFKQKYNFSEKVLPPNNPNLKGQCPVGNYPISLKFILTDRHIVWGEKPFLSKVLSLSPYIVLTHKN